MAGGKTLEQVIAIAGKLEPSLQQAIGKADKMTSGMSSKLKKTAAISAGAFAAVGTAAGAALMSAAKSGDEFNAAINSMGAATGTYGDDLQALGEIVKNVYANNFGESITDVTEKLTAMKQVTGLSGEELQRATENGILLADTFDMEINESARAADTLMKNFGISADEAYGLMVAGAQNGANKNDDLLDTLNEYSNQYASLGLSAQEFTSSLIAGAESGAWSIDKVGDAVKEFNIRAKDGSDSSAEAFKAIGMSAEEMTAKFAAGGQGAHDAFFEVVRALDAMDDPVAKNAAAIGLFGTQYEDLEANVLPALASIEGASIDTATALEAANRVKYSSLSDAIEAISRQLEVAFLPLGQELADSLTYLLPVVQEVLDGVLPIITQGVAAAAPLIQEFVFTVGDGMAQIAPIVTEFAASLMPFLSELTSAVLPVLLGLIGQILPPLMQVIQAVLPVLMQLMSSLAPILTMAAQIFASLVSAVMPLVDPLMQLVSILLPPIAGLITGILTVIQPVIGVIEGIAGAVGTLVGWIAQVIDLAGQAASALAGIGDFVGGGVSALGGMLGFATGGFTNGLAIAGEDPRYPTEAVISFNPAYRAQNLKYWRMAGAMLGAAGGSTVPVYGYAAGGFTGEVGTSLFSSDYGLSGGAVVDSTTYDLSGLTFSPQVNIRGNADAESVLSAVRELEPEFVDLILDAISKREEGAYA